MNLSDRYLEGQLMTKHRIKYPLGEAICPVCSCKFDRLRWFTQYCSARCRKAWSASKAYRQAQNLSDRSSEVEDLRSEVSRLEAENKMLRQRLSGSGPVAPFKYDDENQDQR